MKKCEKLERLVLASLMAGSVAFCSNVWAGMPDETECDPYRGPATVVDYEFDGKPFIKTHIYTNGFMPAVGDDGKVDPNPENGTTLRPFGVGEKEAFEQGLKYWSDVLPVPATMPLVNVYLQEEYSDNAGAGSPDDGDLTSLARCFQESFVKDTSKPIDAFMLIDLAEKGKQWSYSGFGILPTNGVDPDYQGTVIHELFHALGVATNLETGLEGATEIDIDLDGGTFTRYEQQLHDFRGTALKDCNKIAIINDLNAAKDAKTFYVFKDPDAERYGGVYFQGKHVDEVLTINDQKAKLEWPDGSVAPAVLGLPINGYEGDDESGEVELSHFELQNSLQSHQNYRNWCAPMEAELAVMQDLGYSIDRRKLYGNSIYNSGITYVNNNHYFAREGGKYVEGKPSTQSLGLGLHIYGSNNNITQAADLLADGDLSMGIRVDGVGNKLTVAEGVKVTANGKNGRGINFAYGKGHELKVEGTVTATGEGGKALAFDFGDNELGNRAEYRGSYIRADYDDEKEEIGCLESLTANQGSLVNKVDISGKVGGKKAAVYIARNAFVKNINIQAGAELNGDFISNWSPKFCADVMGDDIDIPEEFIKLPNGEDGFTRLNFAADNLDYEGNINSDNYKYAAMIMNVKSGTLNYTGEAEINSVNIEKNAILQGGTFTLDTENSHIRTDNDERGCEEVPSGTLANKGMISAALPKNGNTVLNITGNVNNDGGSMAFIANGNYVGTIKIDGEISGNNTLAVNPNGGYLPGDTFNVTSLVTYANGETVEFTDAVPYETAMLKAVYGDKFGSDYSSISFEADNNLNSKDSDVNAAFDEMYNLARAVSSSENQAWQEKMGELYKWDRTKAVKALKGIKGKQAANVGVVMQQNNLVRNTLGMRLNQVNRAKAVKVNVPIKQFTEGEAINEPMDIIVKPEYDMWAKISRNKGAVNNASDYKTNAYSIGWDKQVNKDWRFGFFGSFAKGRFEADSIYNSLEDYRLGAYGGYNKGAAEAMVYADYGWGKNKLSRTLRNLDMSTSSKYDSNIMEIGAEYKYDLQHDKNKAWHVAPYGAAQLSRYSQKAYDETGAEPFNKNVGKLNNTYAGLEAGVDLERRFANGSGYGMRVGYKRGLTGVDPKLNYHYAADPEHRYINYGESDKNKLVLRLNGDVQTAPNWSISGEAGYERGKKGHGYSAEISVKYTW